VVDDTTATFVDAPGRREIYGISGTGGGGEVERGVVERSFSLPLENRPKRLLRPFRDLVRPASSEVWCELSDFNVSETLPGERPPSLGIRLSDSCRCLTTLNACASSRLTK